MRCGAWAAAWALSSSSGRRPWAPRLGGVLLASSGGGGARPHCEVVGRARASLFTSTGSSRRTWLRSRTTPTRRTTATTPSSSTMSPRTLEHYFKSDSTRAAANQVADTQEEVQQTQEQEKEDTFAAATDAATGDGDAATAPATPARKKRVKKEVGSSTKGEHQEAEQPGQGDYKMMSNEAIARVFNHLADLLAIKGEGEGKFQVTAYRAAAQRIENADESMIDLWRRGQLQTLEGVGKQIAEKIASLLRSGTFDLLDRLNAEIPPGVIEMTRIEGVGPKRASQFWKAGIETVEELEAAGKAGLLTSLPGIGPRSAAKLLAAATAALAQPTHQPGTEERRLPLKDVWQIAEDLVAGLRAIQGVHKASVSGSLRRMRATIGDIDILVAADSSFASSIMSAFSRMPQIQRMLVQGNTKASGVLRESGMQVDVRVIEPRSWGTALQYFTGSKEHNVALRNIALSKGYSLSEYSLAPRTKNREEVFCEEEEQVYTTLGVSFVPPELRENAGEFTREIPDDLIQPSHIHGGVLRVEADSSLDSVLTRISGMQYVVCILQYTACNLPGEKDTDAAAILKKRKNVTIDDTAGVHTFQGVEVLVTAEGGLAASEEVLQAADVVIAHVDVETDDAKHTDANTLRVVAAINHPRVNILSLHTQVAEVLDWERVFTACAEHMVAVEVDAATSPLNHWQLRRALDNGCCMILNTDSDADHGNVSSSRNAGFYSTALARRAWATRDQVVNAWEMDGLLRFLAKEEPLEEPEEELIDDSSDGSIVDAIEEPIMEPNTESGGDEQDSAEDSEELEEESEEDSEERDKLQPKED
eukprot:jgi/Chlat1/6777/Chrsp50S06465